MVARTDQVGAVGLHANVAGPDQRREDEPTALIGEANVVRERVDGEHARVEESDGCRDAGRLEEAHVPGANVGRNRPT